MKKYLYRFAVFLILIVIGVLTANYLIKNKIEDQLKQQENLQYEDLTFNILNGNISFKTVQFIDDKREIQSEELDINLDLIAYLTDKSLKFNKISADGLGVIWKATQTTTGSENLDEEITIQKIDIENANFQYKNKNKTLYSLKSINLIAEDLTWPMQDDLAWLNSVEMTGEELDFDINNLHDLKSESFKMSDGNIEISQFQIQPKYSKKDYIKYISTEKDRMDLSINTVEIMNFGVENNDDIRKFSANKILIKDSDFEIYRDKTIADDKSIKPLYSEALRGLGFHLNIDSVQVAGLDITYQELLRSGATPAEIKFNEINGNIANIHNYKRDQTAIISTKASAKFSESSSINFSHNFNPMDTNNQFFVGTSIESVEDSSVNSFFAPALSMKLDGSIDKLRSKMTSQNNSASGTLHMAYEELKIKVLNKNGTERSFASLLSNVFVKNKNVDVEHKIQNLKRDETKSFWNYVWKFIQSGIKKTLL
ncbi:hypothetical protein [Psychroflexus aestuariivivens]|uniref:hypothetical protein n=1 Tax=Psychroflexus aestuariivivens TaxID=1795040 RepID=UPI000FD829DF|nr:hypothetical protein [Psychroflexus aestuariivivens]